MAITFSKKSMVLIIILILLLLLSVVWVWYGVQLKKIDKIQQQITNTG
ncbi:MAG: hypothetical protein JNM88_17045 [Chitinophagaceae bacterium]|nr:hypothetical protein [Chitinophagaceae bacterium]